MDTFKCPYLYLLTILQLNSVLRLETFRISGFKNPEIRNALVSKRSTLLSCKIVNKYKYAASYA